jgi:hypothetical protein
MLCIFAFVIFLIFFPILGIFPEYRRLFRRSWQCFFKKVTLQPCDINLGEEIKSKLLGKFVFRFPKTTKFFDKTFAFWAFLFVLLNIWSIVYASNSLLNLWVYDTCEPVSGEGCSLSGEACGVATTQVDPFFDSEKKFDFQADKLGDWAWQPFDQLGKTLSRIPDRFTNWNAKDYLASKPSYYQSYDDNKKVAVEAIDPSCVYCGKLFQNIKDSGFYGKYNLSYILYPIPSSVNVSGTRFQHSTLMASYIEALKDNPLQNASPSADWQLLDKFFTAKGIYNDKLQDDFKSTFTKQQAEDEIASLLSEIGYNSQQIDQIKTAAHSDDIKNRLAAQKDIVEKKIKTIKIPTIIFNGRRYDRVVDADTLRNS